MDEDHGGFLQPAADDIVVPLLMALANGAVLLAATAQLGFSVLIGGLLLGVQVASPGGSDGALLVAMMCLGTTLTLPPVIPALIGLRGAQTFYQGGSVSRAYLGLVATLAAPMLGVLGALFGCVLGGQGACLALPLEVIALTLAGISLMMGLERARTHRTHEDPRLEAATAGADAQP